MISSKLFDEILAKPVLHVGSHSISKIKTFMDGYIHAKWEAGEYVEDALFLGFQAWIEQKFRLEVSAHWVRIIEFMFADESYAFEQTKEIWEEYKAAIQADTKLLVSACLLGQKVRFDGADKDQGDKLLKQLIARDRVVAICPEVAGGLGVPRLPAEIQHGDGAMVLANRAKVLNAAGEEVTEAFVSGARQALALAQEQGIKVAILKARSPSCGNEQIYDGTFSKALRDGQGVTAALLERHGIKVFNEAQINEAVAYAASLTTNEVS